MEAKVSNSFRPREYFTLSEVRLQSGFDSTAVRRLIPIREVFSEIRMAFRNIPSRRQSALAWNFFCDIISHIPVRIERLLRQKCLFGPLNYRDRVYIAAFGFKNGVSIETLFEMLHLNPNCTYAKVKKIVELYPYWSSVDEVGQERRSRYWAYDIIIGRICDLNGNVVSDARSSYSRLQ